MKYNFKELQVISGNRFGLVTPLRCPDNCLPKNEAWKIDSIN